MWYKVKMDIQHDIQRHATCDTFCFYNGVRLSVTVSDRVYCITVCNFLASQSFLGYKTQVSQKLANIRELDNCSSPVSYTQRKLTAGVTSTYTPRRFTGELRGDWLTEYYIQGDIKTSLNNSAKSSAKSKFLKNILVRGPAGF